MVLWTSSYQSSCYLVTCRSPFGYIKGASPKDFCRTSKLCCTMWLLFNWHNTLYNPGPVHYALINLIFCSLTCANLCTIIIWHSPRKINLKCVVWTIIHVCVHHCTWSGSSLKFEYLCICVFEYLCICVFVYLCICVFVFNATYMCVAMQHCVVGGLVWAPPSAIVLWSSTVTTKATLPLSATIIAAFATLVPFSPPWICCRWRFVQCNQ